MSGSTDFAALVRELRDHLGLTQEQLAQQLGVSFSTVNVNEIITDSRIGRIVDRAQKARAEKAAQPRQATLFAEPPTSTSCRSSRGRSPCTATSASP